MRSYVLDATDTIVAIDGNWQEFWSENDGDGDIALRILGRVLWDEVNGAATTSYLGRIHYKVRQAMVRVSQQYRCDSPLLERVFSMRVEPVGHGRIRVEHLLIRSRPQKLGLIRDVPNLVYCQCSQCQSCNVGGAWVSHLRVRFPEGAVAIDAVCPTCLAGTVVAEVTQGEDQPPLYG